MARHNFIDIYAITLGSLLLTNALICHRWLTRALVERSLLLCFGCAGGTGVLDHHIVSADVLSTLV